MYSKTGFLYRIEIYILATYAIIYWLQWLLCTTAFHSVGLFLTDILNKPHWQTFAVLFLLFVRLVVNAVVV